MIQKHLSGYVRKRALRHERSGNNRRQHSLPSRNTQHIRDDWTVKTEAAVKLRLLRDDIKQVCQTADPFGPAQEQITAGIEREVEKRNEFILRFRIQIDQEIAATNYVNFGKGRISYQVLDGEDHGLADLLGDLITPVVPDKEP
jgi:hypothetical protein